MYVHILDELLPQLGVFQRAMRLIRNELHGNALIDHILVVYTSLDPHFITIGSVYSSHHFTSGGRYGNKKSAKYKPEQLPYFEIARKCMAER